MIAVDSSAIVAAFASWHECHQAVVSELERHPCVAVGHALLESYSVLTRLPAPHRAEPTVVAEYLVDRFRQPPLVLTPPALRGLPVELAALGIKGGAVYDALIGRTAAEHGAVLLTCDTRAAAIYEAVGCNYRMITFVADRGSTP